VLCRSGEARLQLMHSLNLPQIIQCFEIHLGESKVRRCFHDLLWGLSHSVFGFKMCNGRQFSTSYFPLPVIDACNVSQIISILPNSRHISRIPPLGMWISDFKNGS